MNQIYSDDLTVKLLSHSRKYDKDIEEELEKTMISSGVNVTKHKIENDLKFIDDKIRLMNEMANDMDKDYERYGKILVTVKDLADEREKIEQQAEVKRIADKKRSDIESLKRQKEDEVKFYDKKQADQRLIDLKNRNRKPKPEPRTEPLIKPKSSSESKPISKSSIERTPQIVKTTKPQNDIQNKSFFDDEELSELRDDEEKKIEDILKGSLTELSLTIDSKIDTQGSFNKIMRDVFDDEAQQPEKLNRKSSISPYRRDPKPKRNSADEVAFLRLTLSTLAYKYMHVLR